MLGGGKTTRTPRSRKPMDEQNLRKQVEEYVRQHYAPAFEQLRKQKPLTDDEYRERVQQLPPVLQQFIDTEERPPLPMHTSAQQEAFIARKTDEILPFVIKNRSVDDTAPITEMEIHRVWMDQADADISNSINKMKASINAGHPAAEIMRRLLESTQESRVDLQKLRDAPSE